MRNVEKIKYLPRSNENVNNVFYKLKYYQLNTVIYGTASAAFLAVLASHQVATENISNYLEACKIILSDLYRLDQIQFKIL